MYLGPNKATVLLTDAFSGSRTIPDRTGDFSSELYWRMQLRN